MQYSYLRFFCFLFVCLVFRFRVPDTVPPQTKTLIQMRVCTVLKHWLEPHIDELGDVLDTITNFIETEMTGKELQVLLACIHSILLPTLLGLAWFFTYFFFLFSFLCRALWRGWKIVFRIAAADPTPLITTWLPHPIPSYVQRCVAHTEKTVYPVLCFCFDFDFWPTALYFFRSFLKFCLAHRCRLTTLILWSLLVS